MGEKTRVATDGMIEGIDPETGEVLWRQKQRPGADPSRPKKVGYPRGRPRKIDPSPTHIIIDGNGQKILAPKGTNPDHVPHAVWPFAKVTCDHICNLIAQGHTISQVGLMEGLPTANVIMSWQRDYPEFRSAMKVAREMRAEIFHDKIIEVAKDAKEGTAKRDRLRLDAYKWVSQVNDPGTFGQQTKITGDANAPLKILVETGVRLASDPVPVENDPSAALPSPESLE